MYLLLICGEGDKSIYKVNCKVLRPKLIVVPYYLRHSTESELKSGCDCPLHPSVNMHILHTVLYTFLKVLTRRICLTIKNFFSW